MERSIDLQVAGRFLSRLDPAAGAWCFRVIPDSRESKSAQNLSGTLQEIEMQLRAAQRQGAGIFVVVNAGGHRSRDINRVRAVFADTDGAPIDPILGCGLAPHLVVESSPGKWHVYWLVDGLALDEFKVVQRAIAQEFGTDPVVCDLPRVMRLPGSWHQKGKPFLVRIQHVAEFPAYAREQVLARFGGSPAGDPPPVDKSSQLGSIAAITANRHADILRLSAQAGWLVHIGAINQHAAMADLKRHREAGRWNRKVEDRELEDALEGAIFKYRNGIWRAGEDGFGEPEPLRRPLPPAAAYPVEALGLTLGGACSSIHRIAQVPDAVCGSAVLAAASLATQAHANVELDGRVCPLSLWFLSIAESGDRKTSADTEALRPIRRFEERRRRAYEEAIEEYAIKMEVWSTRRDALKTRARSRKPELGFDYEAELKLLGPEPEPPQLPVVLVGDFTAEGLAKHLVLGRPSIGAFTDEAALVFGGHAMTKESIARTAGTMCVLWDRGELDRMRAGDPHVKLAGRRLAVHLLAQPVIAERALSDPILSGQGFLPRMLMAWPQSLAGQRLYHPQSVCDSPELIAYGEAMTKLMERPLPLSEAGRNELAPRELRLSAAAIEIWRALYDDIEQDSAPTGRYSPVKAWASKMAEQALRIAGVLALSERYDASEVPEEAMRHAAALARWYLDEAVRLVGLAELPADVRDAETVLSWCWTHEKVVTCSSDLLRLGPPKIREAEALEKAMRKLERAGWAIRLPADAVVDGKRRRRAWAVLPERTDRDAANVANPV